MDFDGHAFPLVEEQRFTFGRSGECTARLAVDDSAISRVAGSVYHDGGTWWLSNDSGTRLFAVVDEFGFRSVVPPGRRVAVEEPVRVVLDGTDRVYTLRVSVPGAVRPPDDPRTDEAAAAMVGGTLTAAGENVMINGADRLALVALFAGYLEDPPRHDPYPRSYAAAAA
ncbi:FHA domain-containing protein, partial [Frankia sp. EI5c]|uniref:FHA domain-containing protein n=1 Tax=Frankia sp. EI5c TaxID=683316 RepID=UPI001A7EB3F6